MIRARVRTPFAITAAVAAAGCTLIGGPSTITPPPPPNLVALGDPVPYDQPPSARGNMAEYEQGGRTYRVLDTSYGYDERGSASWYGEEFNGRPTSSGETFDMYALTGAHRTLPIPTYVRVTNLSNGLSVVVRVNDRGPFRDPDSRIIDLSYAAALRLDMVRDGTAGVRVQALEPWQYRVR
ncbi:MAG: septal ring lytic transglycosylase RlpA family protein [Gemmatimonadetes bacterium]|nr:septal ring lytic transglycosylase RlpA family protein [Gemmatimonadota bacterium]